MSATTPPIRGRLTLLVASALLACVVVHALRWWFVCDDAYISFRYAKHVASGAGLVFNLGENPPVEGYTNLLWTVWSAVGLVLGLSPMWLAPLTSLGCAALLTLGSARLAARLGQLTPWQVFAAGACTAALPTLGVWSSGGLETMACATAVFFVAERLVYDAERPRVLAASVCAALATGLRADGVVFVGMALCGTLLLRPSLRAAVVRTGCAALLAVGMWMAVRFLVHEHWLPLTAQAKTGWALWRWERGAFYAGSMLLAMPALVVLVLAPLIVQREYRRLASVGTLAVLAMLGWSVLVGGDFMAYGRFLAPALGFVTFAAAALAKRHVWLPLSLCGLSLLPAFGVEWTPQAWRQALHFRWNEPLAKSESDMWLGMKTRADEWLALGRAMATRTEPGQSIVLGGIGAIGYATELTIFDQYGLVSPSVVRAGLPPQPASPGHDRRVDAEFFFPERPTYLGAWFARPQETLNERLPQEWLQLLAHGEARIDRYSLREEEAPFEGAELRMLRLLR